MNRRKMLVYTTQASVVAIFSLFALGSGTQQGAAGSQRCSACNGTGRATPFPDGSGGGRCAMCSGTGRR